MQKWKVIAFYTANSPYKEVLEKYLMPSIMKFELPYEIVELPNFHNWHKNVAQKPLFIKDMLEKDTKNVVVLDADATIERYPRLFDELEDKLITWEKGPGYVKYDIAVHYLDWATWYNRPGITTKELLTGTMWLRNCDRVKDICQKWYDNAVSVGDWEQAALARVLKKEKANIYELPLEYIYIDTLPDGKQPHVKIEDPVIRHHQVSRKLKKVKL